MSKKKKKKENSERTFRKMDIMILDFCFIYLILDDIIFHLSKLYFLVYLETFSYLCSAADCVSWAFCCSHVSCYFTALHMFCCTWLKFGHTRWTHNARCTPCFSLLANCHLHHLLLLLYCLTVGCEPVWLCAWTFCCTPCRDFCLLMVVSLTKVRFSFFIILLSEYYLVPPLSSTMTTDNWKNIQWQKTGSYCILIYCFHVPLHLDHTTARVFG